MDLGSAICRPKSPDCEACPLNEDCAAFALGRPEDFPAPKARAYRPHRHGLAYWHERDGALYLVRRPEKGLLGGMAALPGSDWREDVAGEDLEGLTERIVAALHWRAPSRRKSEAQLRETSPYRGLFPFRFEDASLYFGRERFIHLLRDAVETNALPTTGRPKEIRGSITMGLASALSETTKG